MQRFPERNMEKVNQGDILKNKSAKYFKKCRRVAYTSSEIFLLGKNRIVHVKGVLDLP